MPYRVIRTTRFPHAPESTLDDERRILGLVGAEVIPVVCDTPEDLIAAAQGADALFNNGIRVTGETMDAMPHCRGIVTATIGYDAIDIAAATARGIPIANVPDFCVREVANHTMGLLIACSRKIVYLHEQLRAGVWDFTLLPPMPPIHGETLGLVSFGRIARAVATRARAFEMRLLAYDPYLDPAVGAEYGVELVPFDTLLRESDYLSVHTLLNAETRHLLSDREFSLMKPTATVINTGRGPVIDEAALIRALQEGRIGGAGLDVFEQEPVSPENPLVRMPNVVLTPHSAGFSDLANRTGRRTAAEDLARMVRGEMPVNLINRELLER